MNKSFTERMIRITIIAMSAFFLLALACTVVLYRGHLIGFINFIVSAGVVIALAVLSFVLLNQQVLQPYHKSRSKFRQFTEGLMYDELFAEQYQIFPEMQLVLNRFHNMLDKQSAIKVSTKQAEYLALQNQINPHFLYNTLEAIRGEALSGGKEDIANITQALSKFFRYTITDIGSLVTLEDELENAENYFRIQEYRFGTKIKMLVNLPKEERDILQLQVPKLTFQPVIENAIFHGLEGKAEGGTVTIQTEITADKLFVNISDNGIGIGEEQLEQLNAKLDRVSASYVNENRGQEGGIALKNVSRRIKLLFGEEYGLHIYSLAGAGTDVRIVMPLIWSGDIRV